MIPSAQHSFGASACVLMLFATSACSSSSIGTQTSEASAQALSAVVTVSPVGQTGPAHSAGDNADDTAIWIHPHDRSLSTIIGDDKGGGMIVWDLHGRELQHIDASSHMNNVDLRYEFPLGDKRVSLVSVGNENHQALSFYAVNPDTRVLEHAGIVPLPKSAPYGGCMYRSQQSGKFYYFVNWKDGTVQQWELDGASGSVQGLLVRTFDVGTQTEGCVADDDNAQLYIGEEDVAIWKYGAQPEDAHDRVPVDSTSPRGRLVADVEGLSLYRTADPSKGYLIASSQGNSRFMIYERNEGNAFVGAFQIGSHGPIDEVTSSDGCEVTNMDLGREFPGGLFVAHDSQNPRSASSNHKLVSWLEISNKLGLLIDTAFDPRN